MCEKECKKTELDASFLAQDLIKQPESHQQSPDYLIGVVRKGVQQITDYLVDARDQAYKLYKGSGFGGKPSPGVVVDAYNPDQPSFPDKTPQIARDLLGCGYEVGEIFFPTVIVSTPTPFKPYKRRTRMFKKRAMRKKHGPKPFRHPLW